MCNPALIGLGLMAVGTGATYLGQRQGAKAARSVASREDRHQRKLRAQSLTNASQVADLADPRNLQRAIAQPQATVDDSQRQASVIAHAAMNAGNPGAVGGQIYDAAVSDAGRSVAPEAQRQGFAQGLEDQQLALSDLAQKNLFLNEDSRRSLAMLQGRLARAGRRGAGLRLFGQLANTTGGAMTGSALWGPAAGMTASGSTGLGRTARYPGGRVPENA